MAREARKPKGGGRRPVEWGIVAHFARGGCAWFFVDDRYREPGGAPERWGRESQAARFAEDEARRRAAGMALNSAVRAYEAVPLPPAVPRADPGSPRPWSPDQRSW